MGLDMYLRASLDVAENSAVQKSLKKIFPEISTLPVPRYGGRVRDICVEVGYWRKANAIHAWFIRKCADGQDECQPVEVSHKKLDKLLDSCRQVLNDPAKAPDLLPTQDGFFFGSTEYDDYYFQTLRDTVVIITMAQTHFKDWDLEYISSW